MVKTGYKKGERGLKTELLREFFATNPDASVKEGAEAVGTSYGYASAIKYHGQQRSTYVPIAKRRQAKAAKAAKAEKQPAEYPVPARFPVNNSANGASNIRSAAARGEFPMELVIKVPADGIMIRLDDANARTIGTLIANGDRLQFVRAYGRKGAPRSTISWDRMAALFESGIL